MLALGAFRFRNVSAHRGGPISRLQHGAMTLLGRRKFQVCAWLKPELVGEVESSGLFSTAAGTGTDSSLMLARFMAISEALERWAYGTVAGGARYGFDVDPTSNGMAAFPGIWRFRARAHAQAEAAERAALFSWWERGTAARRRPAPWPGISAVELAAPRGFVAAVVYTATEFGHYAYGHAAARDFPDACRRAVVEMARHAAVVRRHWQARQDGTAPPLSSRQDARAWYFSTPAGHARFLAAVQTAVSSCRQPEAEVVYDGPIPGPWSAYADVWRVACRPPTRRFLEDGADYFFW